MKPSLGVIIVVRDHGATIGKVLASISAQSAPPRQTVVVDCGSRDLGWVEPWKRHPGFTVALLGRNAGFSGGNNEGLRHFALPPDLVLFLNPDVLVAPDLFGRLVAFAEEPQGRELAAWSVRLMGWDFERDAATGRVDSTGIFPYWNGWRDRREGSPPQGDWVEQVPALCGAFFVARHETLRRVSFSDGSVWDERYLAHKEDVELSLRLRRAGGKLGVWHGAEAWHGRGWDENRRAVPRQLRVMAARNEIRLHMRYAWRKAPMSVLKWIAVRVFNV